MNKLDLLIKQSREMKTIIGQRAWTSIKLGQVYLSPREIEPALSRFGQNLARYTHDERYEIQLIGSATGLSFGDNKYLFATHHQVTNLDPSDIGVIDHDSNSIISSAGFSFFPEKSDSDAQDFCAFDFSSQSISHSHLSKRFFDLTKNPCISDEDNIIIYLAYGCAFAEQRYEVDEKNSVANVIRSMLCKPDGTPNDPALRRAKLYENLEFDPDGISGGPVFAICLEHTEPVLKFAGIINRAGEQIIHFIKAHLIFDLLKKI